jgi:hypothetical protein
MLALGALFFLLLSHLPCLKKYLAPPFFKSHKDTKTKNEKTSTRISSIASNHHAKTICKTTQNWGAHFVFFFFFFFFFFFLAFSCSPTSPASKKHASRPPIQTNKNNKKNQPTPPFNLIKPPYKKKKNSKYIGFDSPARELDLAVFHRRRAARDVRRRGVDVVGIACRRLGLVRLCAGAAPRAAAAEYGLGALFAIRHCVR